VTANSIYDKPVGTKALKTPLYGLCPYKAGSTMLFNYMMDICKALDVQYVNYPGWLWTAGHNLADTCYAPANADEIYNLNMAYVGNREPISGLGSVVHESAHAFTMIRDPRDCLVSMYFSFLGSHPAPASFTPAQKRAWNAQKQKTREETSIDEYVLQKAPGYKNNLLGILAFSERAEMSTVVKYEDFILDKLGLCQEIVEFLSNSALEPIDTSSIDLENIARARDLIPENERPNQHVRRAIPGDHIEKLKPETIDELNALFSEVMLQHGYLN
jgi:hypothetical protein